LKNGWDETANRKVTFSVAETGRVLHGDDRRGGVASCDIRPLRPHKDKVTASFAGAQDSKFVDLPAESTAMVCSNGNCNSR
jgi:hypothetical protein